MTYSEHLTALIVALQAADPSVSDIKLSRAAGVSKGWVSDFRRRGRGVTHHAEAVVEAIRRLCPPGEDGDQVRKLLSHFEAGEDSRQAA